ncbi:uncharacterized protein LOC119673195 [Teleopsis dalmanni]|uniref:uncharacterized protein LOC119673195 n=1 Tax=Teleopsis dalmanni TaxID=139649 RepID=UPI0018CF344E|nr:uncharacterized protein LOC119673195 [Teleopsis dalmanni]
MFGQHICNILEYRPYLQFRLCRKYHIENLGLMTNFYKQTLGENSHASILDILKYLKVAIYLYSLFASMLSLIVYMRRFEDLLTHRYRSVYTWGQYRKAFSVSVLYMLVFYRTVEFDNWFIDLIGIAVMAFEIFFLFIKKLSGQSVRKDTWKVCKNIFINILMELVYKAFFNFFEST